MCTSNKLWFGLCSCLQDELRRLAVKPGCLAVGTRYWAKQALSRVMSSILTTDMQILLSHQEDVRDLPERGALLVVMHCCHADTWTLETIVASSLGFVD